MGGNRIFEGATINGKKYKTLSEIVNAVAEKQKMSTAQA